MSASELVAVSLANLTAASYAEAMRPSDFSSQLTEIAAGHLARALDGFKAEIVADLRSVDDE